MILRLALARAILSCASAVAEARIVKLKITRVESPAFGGATFGGVGTYDRLAGRAQGEVDPAHPLNAIIQDIALAPRNARGMVEYSTDVDILKPTDLARATASCSSTSSTGATRAGWSPTTRERAEIWERSTASRTRVTAS
jgi:hypothetical protein